ncbi:MAG TPA: thermostable hemolysin [Rhodocyclaceae bacterium]|nr:thermostable hemolysin [Rhodocyclaceae bacterium]HMZ84430.1 thermostable hemolysin [Rhodocyclaceae bacterium]HNA04079.1 thermostable hemolysin [Rhodocyclaceae bacterium]HNB79225.1 thermostable hemolysin [Rhodocyclaceae bacterium]HNH12558.1 thermostable hemolysin [Rhodocyclaceae bacterium]
MDLSSATIDFAAADGRDAVFLPVHLPRTGVQGRLERIDAHHWARGEVERFICQRFRREYGARVTHFMPHLMAERDERLQWKAAVGYTPADTHELFLEHYLDEPVESALSRAFEADVTRDEVVEVGNLAADTPGAARRVIHQVTRYLHHAGFRWVVFTATRELANSFRRLHLIPTELAVADPARLPDRGSRWGSYYSHDPRVMGGNIAWGYDRLPGVAG